MNGEKKGIIVTLISEWSPVMGYVVIAENPDEGRDLQKQLFGLFGKWEIDFGQFKGYTNQCSLFYLWKKIYYP